MNDNYIDPNSMAYKFGYLLSFISKPLFFLFLGTIFLTLSLTLLKNKNAILRVFFIIMGVISLLKASERILFAVLFMLATLKGLICFQ